MLYISKNLIDIVKCPICKEEDIGETWTGEWRLWDTVRIQQHIR